MGIVICISLPVPTVNRGKCPQEKGGKKGLWPNCTWKLKGIPVRMNIVADTIF